MDPTPLDYASGPTPRRYSTYSVLACVMAVVLVLWLMYVRAAAGHPPHWLWNNPIWTVALDYNLLPAGIGVVLACIGLIQPDRKRWPSLVALAIILAAYFILTPPMNFA